MNKMILNQGLIQPIDVIYYDNKEQGVIEI